MIDDLWYDRIAAVAIRYCVVSELLAPVLELSDFVLIPLSIAAIAVHAGFAARFALIANGYALPVTTFAIAVDEYALHCCPGWRDIAECSAPRSVTDSATVARKGFIPSPRA